MGRRINKLTPYEIIESFPEECKTILPKELKRLRSILKIYFDIIEEVKENEVDDFKRWYYCELVKYSMPKNEYELYEKLFKIRKIYIERLKIKKSGLPEPEKLDIDRAKNIPIESLYSFDKIKNGRKYITVSCPFHEDKSPSMYIYKESNRYHCFSCGENGDSIDFIMKMYNKNFIESVKYLLGSI